MSRHCRKIAALGPAYIGVKRGVAALRQYWTNDFTGNVRQSIAAAVVEIRQAFVVQSQQMQHGGVQVVDADWVLRGGIADFVSLSVTYTASGHPLQEAVRVVVTATAVL